MGELRSNCGTNKLRGRCQCGCARAPPSTRIRLHALSKYPTQRDADRLARQASPRAMPRGLPRVALPAASVCLCLRPALCPPLGQERHLVESASRVLRRPRQSRGRARSGSNRQGPLECSARCQTSLIVSPPPSTPGSNPRAPPTRGRPTPIQRTRTHHKFVRVDGSAISQHADLRGLQPPRPPLTMR